MSDHLQEAARGLPRWDVSDVYPSFTSRAFLDDLELFGADVARLQALFDLHRIRDESPRAPTTADGAVCDEVLRALNAAGERERALEAAVHATVSTDSYDDAAQGLASELDTLGSRLVPLRARLAAWVAALGAEALAELSIEAADHVGPLRRLAARSEHQMAEAEEALYAELANTGSGAWQRLHSDVTSQLSFDVALPTGDERLPMAAIRGLATHVDPAVRRAGYDAERAAWPTVSLICAAAMNGVKGEVDIVNRRRGWSSPLDASLFANSVSRPTFEAMQRRGPGLVAGLPRMAANQGRSARPHRPDPLVGPDGATPVRQRRSDLGSGTRRRPNVVRRVRRRAGDARRPCPRRSVDRRSARATASAAARSACRSSAGVHWSSSTGTGASTAPRRPPTNSATPTTTSSWPTGLRCNGCCRWHWPRRRASSARRWSSTPDCAGRPATNGWRCSTSTSSARPRWYSTSRADSCSRPRSSPAVSVEPSAPPNSTR